MSLSYDDIPGFSFKRALNMMEAFWGALERINYFSELFESNESTMEKSNKNPVSPPEETTRYFLYLHESYIDSEGNRITVSFINIEGNYGGHLKDKSNYKTIEKIKLDSIKEMKYKFNPKINSRRRDSVTISERP